MLSFDAETRKLLDVSYQGADITRRRMANMDALAPAPGDTLLDLGCGQGLMTVDLARAVGPSGQVIGIDPSADMLEGARQACAGQDNVRLVEGGAGALPVADGTLDGAVSLQVFEYVPDIPAALEDLRSKLKSGGRLVIGDMQWDTFSLASDDPARMARMCRAWEQHVAAPDVPAQLPALLDAAGFRLIEMRPLPYVSVTLRPDSLVFMLLHLMRGYARDNDLMPAAEADAWFAEQERRAAEGRFFFALTHVIAIALRR
ncbi:methyltransferase domain-containing protein [Seohaeicola saemankumensis]|nr:methyltransferase domain-containing protein [Seohaeicola saemankumensis]MCA0871149.1 methyltransferase domain-containing protein [Seohaeicola saemankumensis]